MIKEEGTENWPEYQVELGDGRHPWVVYIQYDKASKGKTRSIKLRRPISPCWFWRWTQFLILGLRWEYEPQF